MSRKKITSITVDDSKPIVTDADQALMRLSEEVVSYQAGSETKQATLLDVLLRSLIQSGSKGNGPTARYVVSAIKDAQTAKRQAIDADLEWWKAHRDKLYRHFAAYRAEHGCDPEIYPHPDDIVLDQERGVRFVGPWDEESARNVRFQVRIVDTLLWQHALDACLDNVPIDEPKNDGAFLLAMFFENMLPERFKSDPALQVLMIMRRGVMSKRVLLREAYQAWRDLGIEKKRGARFASGNFIKDYLLALGRSLDVLKDASIEDADKEQVILEAINQQLGPYIKNGVVEVPVGVE